MGPFKPLNQSLNRKPVDSSVAVMPSKGPPEIGWQTKMPFGKHKGESPEQVALNDAKHARGYFTTFEEKGGIRLTKECRTLLEELYDQKREEEYDDRHSVHCDPSDKDWEDDDIPF